jgi:hypothetical protein
MKDFKLENTPKIKAGFVTPENYFENFSANLLDTINSKDKEVIPLFKKRQFVVMTVAALLVIALLIPVLNGPNMSRNEIDAVTLENYLSYQTNMSQFDLINALESSDIDNMNSTVALEDETIEDILSSNANLEHIIIE